MKTFPPPEPGFGPALSPIVARLHALHPVLIDLSLGRLERLLARLGNPERHLPPVIHIAGTNGKGSTAAFTRAIAEAAGLSAHVYTSPHLVRFNERVRLNGRLARDDELLDALAEVERVNEGAPITVFEVITAAAFLLFVRHPADLAVIEVGLGGRADATNVIPRPAASAITSLSLDHREFLGETLAAIAGEKAGILKPGVPAITGAQNPEALAVLDARAAALGIGLAARGRDWQAAAEAGGWRFSDRHGSLFLPLPDRLPGAFQLDNAGIAIAALRAAGFAWPENIWAAGVAAAEWPGRLQRLHGRLAALLPPDWELWLDGGHNPGAGQALAEHLATRWSDRPVHLIVGMKQTKDARAFLSPLLAHAASLHAVAEKGQHLALPVAAIIAAADGRALPSHSVRAALAALPEEGPPARVLICGSLYLAGEVLRHELWEHDSCAR
uniref:Dihydrofolate synthase/folylpolyglutamate synthase n=1 Tax=Acidicaldus sp. TaxID=1872105 RepID=A0A8J4HC70_9PROT